MPISSVNRKTHFYNRLSFGWERFEDLSQKNNSDLAESLTTVPYRVVTRSQIQSDLDLYKDTVKGNLTVRSTNAPASSKRNKKQIAQ